jgi:hypothetical protein
LVLSHLAVLLKQWQYGIARTGNQLALPQEFVSAFFLSMRYFLGVDRKDGQQSRQGQDKRAQEKVLQRQAKHRRKNRWPEACACEGSRPRPQLSVDLRKIPGLARSFYWAPFAGRCQSSRLSLGPADSGSPHSLATGHR